MSLKAEAPSCATKQRFDLPADENVVISEGKS